MATGLPVEEYSVSPGLARSSASTRWSRRNVVWAITVAGVWVWTCKQLSLDWSASGSYQFGFAVPWIALFIAWQRISLMPDCLAPSPRKFPAAGMLFFGLVLITAWCSVFIGELLRELDPNWRMVSWVMTLGATLLTVAWLYGCGGTRLLRALAFPLAFAWMAVPWPTKVEDVITLQLRGWVTGLAVQILNVMGISALQRGNIIDMAAGPVSVDAPCAGIISLHSSLMASLFLGEFFRFTLKKRAILILAGSLIAMSANLLRALALSLIANAQGPERMTAYHDTLGWMESVIIVLAIFLLGWAMSSKSQPERAQAPALRLFAPGAPAAPGAYATFLTFLSLPLLVWVWFALTPGGPVPMQQAPLWALKTTATAAGWTVAPAAFSQLETNTFQFNEGQKIDVRGPLAVHNVEIYHLFWKTNAILLCHFGHTPDVCMKGAGWEEVGNPIATKIRIGGNDFPTMYYRFEQSGHEMTVFQTVLFGGAALLSSARDFTEGDGTNPLANLRASRLAMLWRQPRRFGLEALNLYMSASGNQEAKTVAAREVLDQVLVPNPSKR